MENEAVNKQANPVLGFKRKPGFKPPKFLAPKHLALQAPTKLRDGLHASNTTQLVAADSCGQTAAEARYFQVLYTKYQPGKKLRKNKSFADGILEVRASSKKTVLYDPEGKVVSTSTLRGVAVDALGIGSEIVLGGFEVEIDSLLEAEKFRTGEAFLKPGNVAVTTIASGNLHAGQAFKPVGSSAVFKSVLSTSFKPVVLAAGTAKAEPGKAHALHDPAADGAIILNRGQWDNGDGCDRNGRLYSPVVIDPYISRHLRQHQVDGVQFMYECAMGMREGGFGCILADEMGLGKTLQVLALLWTLLRQGPMGRPAIRKALVVAPSTLVQNWADEARKWLGNERLRVMVLQPGADGKQQVLDFRHGHVMPVMVTSYETLRKHAASLAGYVDLLVCDEGHRLKSAQGNKTISALNALNCPRRILLTGTPIQNNLQEFFAMANFVNPDILGCLSTFERVFGIPISRSRDRNASAEEKDFGEKRSAELTKRISQFVLRRTSDINAKYLPPLALYVAFCRPSPLQLQLYSSVLGSSSVRKMLSATGADFGDQALTVLTNLKKICNHPRLYTADTETAMALHLAGEEGLQEGVPMNPQLSGKMSALSVIMEESLRVAGDRVVVVSQSTAALDLVQQLCDCKGFRTVRIDGSTDVAKRQDVVNAFNHYNVGQVFLLSTTAGGAGLNLVGANRLVLYDSHWNPAMDLQAMARVWRDGQKKPCVVYRLLTTGTIDEKMYQRQRMKGDIAATMMDKGRSGALGGKGQGKGQFSKEELKQLFTLRTDTACDTYDILQGSQAYAGGSEFRDVSATVEDAPLASAVAAGHVSFVHYEKKELHDAPAVTAADAQNAYLLGSITQAREEQSDAEGPHLLDLGERQGMPAIQDLEAAAERQHQQRDVCQQEGMDNVSELDIEEGLI